jgi:uncharacterized membrane protein
MTFLLGKKVFDYKTGLIAGTLSCLYAPLIFFGGELLPTVWAAFWSVCLLLLLLKVRERGELSYCLLLGCCMALSLLTIPTFLPFCGLILIWLILKWAYPKKNWLQALGRLTAIAIAFSITVAPAAIDVRPVQRTPD